jgi:DNA processing protein
METDKIYEVGLSMIPGLDPITARLLLTLTGSARNVFNASHLDQVPDLNPILRRAILKEHVLEKAEKELKIIAENGVSVRYFKDEDFPYRLQECPDGPLVLYSRGNCNLDAEKVVAVVGTRQATPYGRDLTRRLILEIAQLYPNMLIISGLAYGIDVIAHQAAMEYGLRTACVLAHGLDTIYPPSHRRFADEMVSKGGANLTELPWGTASVNWRFIQRNRIVAGLCDACVVVESGEKGGSMHTAKMARDYNREVLAFPGRITDTHSKGCNKLIVELTAGMIQSTEDLTARMNWDKPKKRRIYQPNLFVELTMKQESLLNLFKPGETKSGNQLAQTLGWSIQETLAVLIQLELEGLLECLPGGTYRRFM